MFSPVMKIIDEQKIYMENTVGKVAPVEKVLQNGIMKESTKEKKDGVRGKGKGKKKEKPLRRSTSMFDVEA